jgi:DNA polymerase I-like protein with 3'-5' exonuclease and polymerase domains
VEGIASRSPEHPAARIALPIHDELLVQAKPEKAEAAKKIMAQALAEAVDTYFPQVGWDFEAGITISDRWEK